MRLLLDESVPAKLKRHLAAHDVCTVLDMGWSGVQNGNLLALAAADFDAFVTVDKNMPYQQNRSALPLPVFVLDALSNELRYLLPLLPLLESELAANRGKQFVVVRSGAKN